MGGTVSAEHGIGKLKTELLRRMSDYSGVAEIRRVIEIFIPNSRLNRGNIVVFEPA
jgi:D-lactate dehydrogenase (cytochrome)